MSGGLRRRALVIGNELYRDDRWSGLPSARADREQLASVLRDRTIGGFDVTVVGDLDAERMRATIATFCQDGVDDELLLLYVSGHGVLDNDGEFTFVAADTDPDDVAATGVSAGFVNGCLEDGYSAQKVALFDTCQSGGFTAGFRTRPVKGSSVPPRLHMAPVRPRGVYVLASSDVDQYSFSGPVGSDDSPTPSVFTGAVVDILRTGAAGTTGGGFVSVDDLADAVHHRMLGLEPPQTPVKSSSQVVGSIVIASRPSGRTAADDPAAGPGRGVRPAPTVVESDDDATTVPDWPALLGYYADVVRAETDQPELMPVGGDCYVDIAGSERVLRGDVDRDGTIPVPELAETLVAATRGDHGLTLWAGWPTVVVHRSSPRADPGPRSLCAPLLMRRVEVVDDDSSLRLRPTGDVVLHPGLVTAWLEDDEADRLRWSYRPQWHAGESARMAAEAGDLLRRSFGLPSLEQLRPEHLAGTVDVATPGEGARNAAILFGLPGAPATAKLLKDYAEILRQPTSIAGTSLAALHPGASPGNGLAQDAEIVSPLPSNDAQEQVIRSAMTRRLTVATGPPGTGKSQLIANTVATAVAAGQSVLVASTNNKAVDEVTERCNRIQPGLVVRTGSTRARRQEQEIVAGLLRAPATEPAVETRYRALRAADQKWRAVRSSLDTVARHEEALLAAERSCVTAQEQLGWDPDPWARSAAPGWVERAKALTRARWFGTWRRRRFLRETGAVPADGGPLETPSDETRSICAALAQWGASDRDRTRLRDVLAETDDPTLVRELDESERLRTEGAEALIHDLVAQRGLDGHRQIQELQRATASRNSDWGEFRRTLPYLSAWASTSLAARRFPLGPNLFDLVVIDEASQCTIPSIVPLLYRARRAVIIGDPMQLGHITKVDAGTDAELRRRWTVPRRWLSENRLSPIRHSAFGAAEQRAAQTIFLDEHYRCHPDIAGVVNRLFYQGRLTVLTDPAAANRIASTGAAVRWRQVTGRATRGPSGGSWRNEAEAAEVMTVLTELVDGLPGSATIGVVTPYKAQAALIAARCTRFAGRVRVGTAHSFQGGECDAMVFSLVAASNEAPRRFDWIDQRPELWNVAITRARSQLVVVGDAELWGERGGVGAELLDASRTSTTSAGSVRLGLDDDLADRLYGVLTTVAGQGVRIGATVNGHTVDGLLPDGRAVLVGPSTTTSANGAHLRRVLARSRLTHAVRLPAWTLYSDQAADLITAPLRGVEQGFLKATDQ